MTGFVQVLMLSAPAKGQHNLVCLNCSFLYYCMLLYLEIGPWCMYDLSVITLFRFRPRYRFRPTDDFQLQISHVESPRVLFVFENFTSLVCSVLSRHNTE
jgi:hypothetical protein